MPIHLCAICFEKKLALLSGRNKSVVSASSNVTLTVEISKVLINVIYYGP